MLRQSFDFQSLLQVVSRRDVRAWDLWTRDSEIEPKMRYLADEIENAGFTINQLNTERHRGNTTYLTSTAEDHIALKLVDRHIRRIYKVVQSDRNRVIREIRALLGDGGNLSLMREDVKSFYESINLASLIKGLQADMILSNRGVSLVSSLHDQLRQLGNNGLARGIGISATLSELYMEKFDKAIRSMPSTFYFARYVDDIIIVTDTETTDIVKEKVVSELQSIGLELRGDLARSSNSRVREADFSYLGYHFKVESGNDDEPKVDISIAPKKVSKIKSRIIKSFVTFDHDRRFNDLLARLRYLACSKPIKRSETGDVLSGIKYNYRYISSQEKIKVFDAFIAKILNGHTRFGRSLTTIQRDRLRRISFYRATRDGVVTSYSRKKVKHLKKAWVDE